MEWRFGIVPDPWPQGPPGFAAQDSLGRPSLRLQGGLLGPPGPGLTGLLNGVSIDIALIEAAFDQDSLEPGRAYGDVFSQIPQIRILVTHSDLDLALRDAYVAAGVFNLHGGPNPALGFAGPTRRTPDAAGATEIAVDVGFSRTGVQVSRVSWSSPTCRSFTSTTDGK